MIVSGTFRLDADRYGYTLTRLRAVKKRDTEEIVEEFGDPTYHRDLASAQRRVLEYAMRDSVAAAESIGDAIAAFNAAMDRMTVWGGAS